MTTVKSQGKTVAAKPAKSTGTAPAGVGEQAAAAAVVVAAVVPGDAHSAGGTGATQGASDDSGAPGADADLQSGAAAGVPQGDAVVVTAGGALEGAALAAAPTPGVTGDSLPPGGEQKATDAGLSESEEFTQRLGWQDAVVYGFEVSAMRDGFRRAGRAWTREPVFLTEDDITREQYDLLIDEPNIRIVPACRPVSDVEAAQ